MLLLVQGITAVGYCWRFPVMDELSNYAPDMLGRAPPMRYFFGFHNEHGILSTRLLTWALYRFVDANPVIHTACNYLIFVGAILAFRHLLKQLKVAGTDILLCSAALPIAVDVHNWSFQTHFYATFAIFLGALWALSRRNKVIIILAGPLAVLGCLSFSAGVAFACALCIVSVCLALWQPDRRLSYLSAVGGCLAGVAAYGLLRPGQLSGHPAIAVPWALPFWNFMAVQVGGSIGCTGEQARIAGAVILTVSLPTTAAFAWHAWKRRSVPHLMVFGVSLGILGAIALTSLGRAGTELNTFVHTRYTTYTLFIPAGLWAMHAVLFRSKQLYLAALASVFLVQMAPHFQYKRPYREIYESNLEAQRCASSYFLGENSGDCALVLPWNSADLLDGMWRADIFAIKELKRLNAGAKWRYDPRVASALPPD